MVLIFFRAMPDSLWSRLLSALILAGVFALGMILAVA
jgi:hypothetical protein